MFGLTVFLALLVHALVLVGVKSSERIVGLIRIKSLPESKESSWEFLMNFYDVCSGVLMSSTEVLTSCECVLHNNHHDYLMGPFSKNKKGRGLSVLDKSEIRVRTQDFMSLDSEVINITEIQIHPKCDGDGSFDFAMLRLERPVNVSEKFFENFPFGENWNGKLMTSSTPETGCHLATHSTNAYMWNHPLWAKDMYGSVSEIPVVLTEMESCDTFVTVQGKRRNINRNAQICVEAKTKPLPICKADLGSPLICNETLIGITTVTDLLCEEHDTLSIVSSLDEAWDFIYDFMKINHRHWCICWAKRLLRWLNVLFELIITF